MIQPSDTQKHTATIAGITLFAVQHCERTLGQCLSYAFATEQSAEELLRMDREHFSDTLGRLEHKLKATQKLPRGFARQLRKFIEDRNRFIHRLFHEAGFGLDSDTTCAQTLDFMFALLDQASALRTILSGALLSSLHSDGKAIPEEFVDELRTPTPFRSLFHEIRKERLDRK